MTDGLRADTRFAPSQWETGLLCNGISHWLGASLESELCLVDWWGTGWMTEGVIHWFSHQITGWLTAWLTWSVITHLCTEGLILGLHLVNERWREMELLCNDFSHWLCANLKSALHSLHVPIPLTKFPLNFKLIEIFFFFCSHIFSYTENLRKRQSGGAKSCCEPSNDIFHKIWNWLNI